MISEIYIRLRCLDIFSIYFLTFTDFFTLNPISFHIAILNFQEFSTYDFNINSENFFVSQLELQNIHKFRNLYII